VRRGGCVILQVSELLQGDAFPDLSPAALGTWVRIKATNEITGEPVGARQVERLGLVAEALAELVEARLVALTDGRYEAIGMPEPPRKPSDEPEAARERQEAKRLGISVSELRAHQPSPAPSPVNSDQLRSDQVSRGHALSRVTSRDRRDGPTVPRGKYDGMVESGDREAEKRAAKAQRYLDAPLGNPVTSCRRCGGPGTDGNPLVTLASGTKHRFAPCPEASEPADWIAGASEATAPTEGVGGSNV
jgi:hypothetical protein